MRRGANTSPSSLSAAPTAHTTCRTKVWHLVSFPRVHIYPSRWPACSRQRPKRTPPAAGHRHGVACRLKLLPQQTSMIAALQLRRWCCRSALLSPARPVPRTLAAPPMAGAMVSGRSRSHSTTCRGQQQLNEVSSVRWQGWWSQAAPGRTQPPAGGETGSSTRNKRMQYQSVPHRWQQLTGNQDAATIRPPAGLCAADQQRHIPSPRFPA